MMRSVRNIAWAMLVTATLLSTVAGCAYRPNQASAFIGPDLPFDIPGPSALGEGLTAFQLVTVHYAGRTVVFEVQLTVSPARLTLIGLDGFGGRALTVTSTEKGITAERGPLLPEGIRPENILADIAIIYWPEEAVRRGLAASQAVLHADNHGRSITDGGREIIRVTYQTARDHDWPIAAQYRNIAFGYQLDLQSRVISE